MAGLRKVIWSAARLTTAAWLLWFAVADHHARRARLALAALPEMDHCGAAAELRGQGRFSESEQVLLAGFQFADDAQAREALAGELRATIRARDSVLWKLRGFAAGAVSGRGETLEELVGAITADMFVVGDVRDLLIQGGRWASEGQADELLVALSAAGLVTTFAPQLDAAGALVKVTRRAGALSAGMARSLGRLCADAIERGNAAGLRAVLGHVNAVARTASPAVALRVLRLADEPADLARAARLVQRPGGGAVLILTGDDGVRALGRLGPHADDAVFAAARRSGGAGWLKASSAGFRPHPLLGLLKGVYKGNVPRAATALLERLDQVGGLLIPALAAWLYLEFAGAPGWVRRGLRRWEPTPDALYGFSAQTR